MPIPEPEDTEGLWSAVRDKVEWPAGNEDLVRDLAGDWGLAAELFDSADVLDLAELDAAWPDSVGDTFGQSIKVMKDRSSRLEISARQQQADLLTYADIVMNAKNAIREIVASRTEPYGAMKRTNPAALPLVEQQVIDLARQATADAAEAAFQIRTGAAVQGPAGDGYTEYEDISQFMYDELATNVRSDVAENIRALNASGTLAGKAAAAAAWYELVKTGGDWDQKPDILGMTVGANTLTPIPGLPGSIRHDFWSNMHYGYIGEDVGFDQGTLTAAANLVDLKEHFSTDPVDTKSIELGFELRERYAPDQLTPENLNSFIAEHYQEMVDAGVIVPDPQ